ncbi:MAG: anti-sigma factor [Chloroflexi bacterium]|nr:anti-sigma factor [Chloroflexota bacterium]
MPEKQTPYDHDPDNQDQNHNPSNHSLSYEDVVELLPVFVLGALEPDEMLAVDSYISQHQGLIERLAQLEATTAQLAYAAPPLPLPGHVKTQLMQRVQADLVAQQPAALNLPAVFPPRRKIAASPSVVVPPTAPPRKPQTHWFSTVTRTLIGVGVAAAMFLLVFRMIQLRGLANQLATQLASTQQQLTTLQAQNSQLHTINQTLEQQLQDQNTQMAALKTNLNTLAYASQMIELKGTDAAPTANGVFYVANHAGVLMVHDLPPLPKNQTYQFWLIPAEGAPLPAGLIHVTESKMGSLMVNIPDQNGNFAKVGLSIEPSGGSPAPTGSIVLIS